MMLDSYLVQRLKDPPKSDLHAKIEQAFGGSIGMSPEGLKLLRDVFSFDYMGAAEYEFGAIPKCLKTLVADADQLVATPMTVLAKDIEPNWNRKHPARTKAGKLAKKQPVHPPVADRVVYLLCRKEHLQGAQESIVKLAGHKARTKMGSHFQAVLDPIGEEYTLETKGWLELDNGFLFFIDRDMWRKSTLLFMGKDPAPETGALT